MKISDETIEIGRKAVEDELIDLRNRRISILNRGNGFCIREKDSTPSSMIRLATEDGLRIALEAMGPALVAAVKDEIYRDLGGLDPTEADKLLQALRAEFWASRGRK